jgi:hypothetical protein
VDKENWNVDMGRCPSRRDLGDPEAAAPLGNGEGLLDLGLGGDPWSALAGDSVQIRERRLRDHAPDSRFVSRGLEGDGSAE